MLPETAIDLASSELVAGKDKLVVNALALVLLTVPVPMRTDDKVF